MIYESVYIGSRGVHGGARAGRGPGGGPRDRRAPAGLDSGGGDCSDGPMTPTTPRPARSPRPDRASSARPAARSGRRPDPDRPDGPRRLAAAVLLGLLAACGDGEPGAGEPTAADAPVADEATTRLVARARAAAHFAEGRWRQAREELAPLVAADDAVARDLLDAACVELEEFRLDEARAFLDRIGDVLDDDPRYHWARFRLARHDGEPEKALEHVQRAHELVPDSYPTQHELAALLSDMRRDDEAEVHLRQLMARGESFGGSWYPSAVYKYSRLLVARGEIEEYKRWAALKDELEERGIKPPQAEEAERGDLGLLPAPPPEPRDVAASEPLRGALAERSRTPGVASGGMAPVTLALPATTSADVLREGTIEVRRASFAEPALLLWGDALQLARPSGDGWDVETLLDGEVTAAAAFDVDLDGGIPESDGSAPEIAGDLDLVVARSDRLDVLVNGRVVGCVASGEDRWPDSVTVLQRAGAVSQLLPVDFDHDGDTDLAVASDTGLKLLRNDGFGAPGGRLVDVAEDAGLPTGVAARWVIAEDFDTDQDVDLLVGLATGPYLASNARGGRFTDASASLPALGDDAPAPWVGDLDGDGRPDLVTAADGAPVGWVARPEGGWRPVTLPGAVPAAARPGLAAADPFLEGRASVLWPAGGAVVSSRPGALAQPLPGTPGRSFAALDVDGDARAELVVLGPTGLATFDVTDDAGPGLALTLEGLKDAPRGRGAVVEVRAGDVYRRVYARGEPLLLGLGGRAVADVVRVTWPNGVVQNILDVPAGVPVHVEQKEGLVGSCPFLYAWDGEGFRFITDVLGGTPLGLPMGPGVLVPPDHDEFVLLRGDQLAPRDGRYEVQLTEELREVTYLDALRLDVVDHPADTEAHPNERFSFPPFPEERLHVLPTPVAPVRATDDAGRDWTAALAADDGTLATPYRSLGGQFLGLSEPHVLELAFDPGHVPADGPLRLALTGWFLWTDASVNVASARHPGVAFEPPVFSVPDGEGGWRVAGPPPGFPAGKDKTMVLDVGDWLVRDDPRLRIATTLCLAWDAIRLSAGDDGTSRTTRLEADGAELWRRGFSAPSGLADEPLLETYDWDRLETDARWDQHPGRYTRYGDVLPLLGEADDRFVIFGSGDALHVTFPADGLPPLPEGWRRDYLLYLDGWAKDRDPNTERALAVEPLPFHGMSGYPYGADEAFPDDDAHRAWRREWNTRPAHRWIPSLALAPAGAGAEAAR